MTIALTGCAIETHDETLGEDQDELFTPTGVTRFSPGEAIRVCWVTVTRPGETLSAASLKDAKDAFRLEVKNSWERYANVSFIGWDECPTSGTDRYVRIQIRWQGLDNGQSPPGSGSGGACFMGRAAYQLPGPVNYFADNNGLSCGVGPDRRWNDPSIDTATRNLIRSRWQYVAVHEMGHVLGFGHDQDHPHNPNPAACGGVRDSTGTAHTAFDQDSVMNYCGSHGNWFGVLTPDDVRGVVAAYGARSPGPSRFFNGFEGTDANAWWFAGHSGVDRGIGLSRTGANNGWVANWHDWNAANIWVKTGGAGQRCEVEVMTRMSGAPANHNFWILDSSFQTGWFDWPTSLHNVYRPVKFSFDATSDWHILVAGFWGNGSANHFMQLDDVSVTCAPNLNQVVFDDYWASGTSFLVNADHVPAGRAYIKYDNVPVAGGGFTTRLGHYLTPDASNRLVWARDMALAEAGLHCTPRQLSSYIYASLVDSSGATSKAYPIPARLLCFNR